MITYEAAEEINAALAKEVNLGTLMFQCYAVYILWYGRIHIEKRT